MPQKTFKCFISWLSPKNKFHFSPLFRWLTVITLLARSSPLSLLLKLIPTFRTNIYASLAISRLSRDVSSYAISFEQHISIVFMFIEVFFSFPLFHFIPTTLANEFAFPTFSNWFEKICKIHRQKKLKFLWNHC